MKGSLPNYKDLKIIEILQKYKNIFRDKLSNILSPERIISYKIYIGGGAPININTYSLLDKKL